MADLKRCDRCKAIFEPEAAVPVKFTVKLNDGSTAERERRVYPCYISLTKYASLPYGSNVAGADLCPECTHKLNKFMHMDFDVENEVESDD